MRIRRMFFSFSLLFLLIAACPAITGATKWVSSFVVWEGYQYTVQDDHIEESEIESELGQVTSYSDMYPMGGNFSNEFEEGSKYFSIKGVSTEESIAVEAGSGIYVRADRERKYTFVNEESTFLPLLIPVLVIIFVLLMAGTVMAETKLKK
ncbi:hypothetical protein V4V35_14820 [Bacillus infantis]|uniref:hypothetical protein n=1 Tax=Bacillus infantis TaxID=324767 RepID=UPI000B9BCB87|nr:hypothetical protein B9K06_06490 [Bacillus sp. OG2]